MIRFKTYIQEGISREPIKQFGGKSMLDSLIDAAGMVQHIDRHHMTNSSQKHFSIDAESQHVFDSALHNKLQNGNYGGSNYSLSGIIGYEEPNGTQIKIHVIHADTDNKTDWGGLYVGGTNTKEYRPHSNTLHVPFLVSRNSSNKTVLMHELTHALQDLSGGEAWDRANVRGRASNRHSGLGGEWIIQPDGSMINAPAGPPKGRRAKVNRQNEGRPWTPLGSNYFHQGTELNARIMQHIPNIIGIVDQHHAQQGYEDFVKQHSNQIETEVKKYTSPEAQKRYREQQYDKMFDLLSSNFTKNSPIAKIFTNPAGADPSLDRVANPKGAIAVRNEKLKEKQNKNLLALGSHINERQINNLIQRHSGHNVLENRKTREQERSRPRPLQSVEPTEQPQEKPSVFHRFKKFIGLR